MIMYKLQRMPVYWIETVATYLTSMSASATCVFRPHHLQGILLLYPKEDSLI